MDNMQNQVSRPENPQADPQTIAAVTTAVLQTLQATGKLSSDAPPPSRTHEEETTIDLVALFFAILEKFWLVVICALVGTVLMWWIASQSVMTYTATAKLYIVNPDNGINISNLQLGTALTMDYQEVFRTWEVHEMVIEELNLPYTYEQMQSMLSVGNPDDTRILYIRFSHTDPELAARIANAYAKAAKEFIINTMRGEEPSDFSIALQPSVGYAVSKTKYMAMGFLGGSALAIGLLTLLFLLDKGPRSPEAIQTYGGIPTLAIFPHRDKEKPSKPSAADEASFLSEGGGGSPRLMISNFPLPDYASMEATNTLCTNLSYCGDSFRKIMITSRYASEGKSYISMNLMRTLCSLGRRVVLVDADLRASGIQADYRLHYQTRNHNGLSEFLSGRCDVSSVLYQTNVSGAWMIPAGHEAPNPLQLLDTERMKQLMDWLSEQFDIVLLDTPPVSVLVDAVAMGKFCDGALLVVGYRKGKQEEIGEAVRQIKQTGCRMLGAVLNDVKFRTLSNKHYYYNSGRYASHYDKRYRRQQKKATKA